VTSIASGTSGRSRGTDVEAALLAAAESILVRRGPDGVTVRAVAACASVSPMSVYNRFGNKGGLISALTVRGFRLLREAIQVPDDPDPRRRLQAFGTAYRAFGLDRPHYYRLLFVQAASDAEQPGVADGARVVFDVLADQVRQAMTLGALRPADVQEVTQQIWSVLHGALSLELDGRRAGPDPAAAYGRLLDLLLTGLGAGGLGV
jgi:AcrR family transcriptional regulator